MYYKWPLYQKWRSQWYTSCMKYLWSDWTNLWKFIFIYSLKNVIFDLLDLLFFFLCNCFIRGKILQHTTEEQFLQNFTIKSSKIETTYACILVFLSETAWQLMSVWKTNGCRHQRRCSNSEQRLCSQQWSSVTMWPSPSWNPSKSVKSSCWDWERNFS